MTNELPLWLIVSGPPAAGKTTMARRIAQDLRLPLIEKDVLKDALYKAMGFGDQDWSRQIGIAGISLLFLTADRMLQAGSSPITESNFCRQLSSGQAGEIAVRTRAKVVQVHCSAPPDTLVTRNAARLTPAGLRPGHHVMPSEELLGGIRAGTWELLDIPSTIIRVDTSSSFDYTNILRNICQEAPHISHTKQ